MGYIVIIAAGIALVWVPALLGMVPLEGLTLLTHGSASLGVVVLVLLLRWVKIKSRGPR